MSHVAYQSEKGIHLQIEIRQDGDLVDLTGATIVMRMSPRGSDDVVLEKTADILSLGVAEIVFGPGDLDLPAGHYRREWRYFKGPTEQTVYVDDVPLRGSQFYDV